MWKNGFLPHAGGVHDQHPLFVEIMSVLHSAIQEVEETADKGGKIQDPATGLKQGQ